MRTVYGTDGSRAQLADDIAVRVQWVANEFKARGKRFRMTEGYSPTGVPADRYVTQERLTSTGGSNQWYQVGRMDRGLTPSAIIPNSNGSNLSKHSTGNAIDCDVDDMALRTSLMATVGMRQTVASESWHFEIVSAPANWWNASAVVFPGTKPAPSVTPKTTFKELTMLLLQQSDGKRDIFAYIAGAYHVINWDQVTAIQALLRANGISDVPIKLTSAQITHISEAARNASGNYHLRAQLDAVNAKLAAIEKKLG